MERFAKIQDSGMSVLEEGDIKVYNIMSQCLKRHSVRPSSMEVSCSSIIYAAHSDLDHMHTCQILSMWMDPE